MIDISTLTAPELRALQEQIKHELLSREQETIAKARDQITEIARNAGLSLADLMKKAPKPSGPAAVRFQHPGDPSKKWTGRGRQPKWVKEWVEGGKSLDQLRV